MRGLNGRSLPMRTPGAGVQRTSGNLRYLRYQYQVTITEAAQTTTPKFTFSAGAPAAEVDWGDGTARTAVVSGTELSHAYAAPGVYTVTLVMDQQDVYLTGIEIFSDLVVGSLWAKDINRFTALEVLSAYSNADMTGGFLLSDLPAEIKQVLVNGASQVVIAGALTDIPVKMAHLRASNTRANVIGTLSDLPALMLSLRLDSTESVVTGGDTPVAAAGIREVRLDNTALTQAQVDDIINRIYTDRALFTSAAPILNIGGANAAPSGVYQDATPPTTGKEMIYKLVNDPDAEGFRKWTIIYTA